MSLAKVPLVLLFSLSFKRCLTSPNPAPPKSESISQKTFNAAWYTQKLLGYATSLQLLACFAEIATILAARNPGSRLSKSILHTLLFQGGNAANLRVSPATFVGLVMMISGTLIRVTTFRYLGKFFRFEASIQRDHELITGGPYSIVRHPSYTGMLISHPGWFLWQFGAGSWVRESGLWNNLAGKAAVSSFAVVVILGTLNLTLGRMASEDKALKSRFGAQWDLWASRVRYLVIPGVY